LDKLLDVEDSILTVDNVEVHNSELFDAISEHKNFDGDKCYTDLSFFVGASESNVFLSSNMSVEENKFEVSRHVWELICEVHRDLSGTHGVEFIYGDVHAIEEEYLKKMEAHESIENQNYLKEINDIKTSIENEVIQYNEVMSSYSNQALMFSDDLDDDALEVFERCHVGPIKLKNFDTVCDIINKNHQSFIELKEVFDGLGRVLSRIEKSLFVGESINELINQYRNLKLKFVVKPSINLRLHKTQILNWWARVSSDYEKGIIKINSGSYSSSYLLGFLNRVDCLLALVERISGLCEYIPNVLSFLARNNKQVDRINISAHQVFDTGKDVVVYGGAGVGKTTTLQMYSKQFVCDNALLFYLPLNRIFKKYHVQKSILEVSPGQFDSRDNFKHIIILFLVAKGIEVNQVNIDSAIEILDKKEKFKVILDGLDEVYSQLREVMNYIEAFKHRFNNSQLILSSRDCVSYLNKIPFLGVNLLPFTPSQFSSFVKGWVKDISKAERVIGLVEEKEIFGVVRTPLIATILCSLIDKGVEIPKSENEVYQRRLSLLCGDYDDSKGVDRQEFNRDTLELAARKIAFSFHNNRVRYGEIEDLVNGLYYSNGFNYDKNTCSRVVKELVETCNLIIYDSISGKYSFGHFRFQEHLVSLEVSYGRSVDIRPLLSEEWWRGVFLLYSQTNSIEVILDGLVKNPGFDVLSKVPTLRLMAENSNFSEKERNNELISMIISSVEAENRLVDEGFDEYDDLFDDINIDEIY
jgi:hypothetical protein